MWYLHVDWAVTIMLQKINKNKYKEKLRIFSDQRTKKQGSEGTDKKL